MVKGVDANQSRGRHSYVASAYAESDLLLYHQSSPNPLARCFCGPRLLLRETVTREHALEHVFVFSGRIEALLRRRQLKFTFVENVILGLFLKPVFSNFV